MVHTPALGSHSEQGLVITGEASPLRAGFGLGGPEDAPGGHRLLGLISAARHRVGPVLVWAVLGFLVLVPVGAFLLLGFSPRLFGQGTSWLTFSNFSQAFSSQVFKGVFNSLWVSAAVCAIDLVVGGGLAWVVARTDVAARRLWPALMWGLLLVPTYLMAEGWQFLLEPHGVLSQLGLPSAWAYHLFFGPAGVVYVLSLTNAPFAYLAISPALGGLGSQYEEAVRVHGGGRIAGLRVIVPMLAPAFLATIAIVFAETMSDFGVSSTLAFQSNFPMATYRIYQAIDSLPAQFGVASALSWLLVLSAAIPLALQARVTRGRSYAILNGRARAATRIRLRAGAKWGLSFLIAVYFLLALGAPALGAFVGSFVKNLGAPASAQSISLFAYREVFSGSVQIGHATLEGASSLLSPVLLSTGMAAITATVTAVLGLAVAKLLGARRPGRLTRVGDLFLLGSIALPGIVLGAGYIFAFNLPVAGRLGLDLYETLPLLVMGYLATSLPTQSRLMMGPVAQVHGSLLEAARVHGARLFGAWRSAYLPLVSKVLIFAWLLTFAKTFFELPISQLLYPPGEEPVSVAINNYLGNYHYDIGTAMIVVAVLAVFVVIGTVLGGFRLLAPKGWRHVGGVRNND